MSDNGWKEKIENLSKELQKYIENFYVSYREEKLTDTEDDFLHDALEYLVAEAESKVTAYNFTNFVSEQHYEVGHKCPVCDGTMQKHCEITLMCDKCGFIVEPYVISNAYHRSERWR